MTPDPERPVKKKPPRRRKPRTRLGESGAIGMVTVSNRPDMIR